MMFVLKRMNFGLKSWSANSLSTCREIKDQLAALGVVVCVLTRSVEDSESEEKETGWILWALQYLHVLRVTFVSDYRPEQVANWWTL